jgi:hypothetical protein
VSTIQAVILGMMLAWTPSLAILGILLWRAPASPGVANDGGQIANKRLATAASIKYVLIRIGRPSLRTRAR